MQAMPAHCIEHPLVQHKLTMLRERTTTTADFRALLRELGYLLGYEVTRDLPLQMQLIHTPLAPMVAPTLSGKKLCLVPILRAGMGLLDGLLALIPSARVGLIGLYRNHVTLEAVEYYFKIPEDIAERLVIVLDVMLATGHSAAAAIARLKAAGAANLRLLCVLAAPEGLAVMDQQHPDVPVYCAAVDEGLDEQAYILPGLGDAGDRLYGLK